jgi:hypothetical protein
MELTYIQSCGTWSAWSAPIISPIEEFYQNHLFVLDQDLPQDLYVGQQLASFVSDNSLDGSFTTPYTVAALVYKDDSNNTMYTENGGNRTLIGCLLIDFNNNLLKFFDYDDFPVINTGSICLLVPDNVEDVEKIEDFKCRVWKLQCKFASCVSKYLTNLEYGINKYNTLEDLKDQKRLLEILNCYDTRDILEDTTDYNNIEYSEIKKLLC